MPVAFAAVVTMFCASAYCGFDVASICTSIGIPCTLVRTLCVSVHERNTTKESKYLENDRPRCERITNTVAQPIKSSEKDALQRVRWLSYPRWPTKYRQPDTLFGTVRPTCSQNGKRRPRHPNMILTSNTNPVPHRSEQQRLKELVEELHCGESSGKLIQLLSVAVIRFRRQTTLTSKLSNFQSAQL